MKTSFKLKLSPFTLEWLQLRHPRENLESLTKKYLQRLSKFYQELKARRREGPQPVGSWGYKDWI